MPRITVSTTNGTPDQINWVTTKHTAGNKWKLVVWEQSPARKITTARGGVHKVIHTHHASLNKT